MHNFKENVKLYFYINKTKIFLAFISFLIVIGVGFLILFTPFKNGESMFDNLKKLFAGHYTSKNVVDVIWTGLSYLSISWGILLKVISSYYLYYQKKKIALVSANEGDIIMLGKKKVKVNISYSKVENKVEEILHKLQEAINESGQSIKVGTLLEIKEVLLNKEMKKKEKHKEVIKILTKVGINVEIKGLHKVIIDIF